MASGKQSPRQKMINLMYLIFIAMLAMNMSKEVLQAFGLMDTKLVSANEAAAERNKRSYEDLALKAVEQSEKYSDENEKALKIQEMSQHYYTYLYSFFFFIFSIFFFPTYYQSLSSF